MTLTRRWLTREWRSVCCGTWRAARLAEGGVPCNAEQSAGLLPGATDAYPAEVMWESPASGIGSGSHYRCYVNREGDLVDIIDGVRRRSDPYWQG